MLIRDFQIKPKPKDEEWREILERNKRAFEKNGYLEGPKSLALAEYRSLRTLAALSLYLHARLRLSFEEFSKKRRKRWKKIGVGKLGAVSLDDVREATTQIQELVKTLPNP